MHWKDIKTTISQHLTRVFQSKALGSDENSPTSVRQKQILRLSVGIGLITFGVFCVGYTMSGGEESSKKTSSRENKKIEEQKIADFVTPLKPIDERAMWSARLEKRAEKAQQEAEQLRAENQVLVKRIDVIEELFSKSFPKSFKATQENNLPASQPASDSVPKGQVVTSEPSQRPFGSQSNNASGPQHFPKVGYDSSSLPTSTIPQSRLSGITPHSTYPKKKGSKIIHLVGGGGSNSHKPADIYLPTGTYCKAVIDVGVAVSTATNSQGNPEPIRLRLVDNGNLPGGLKSQVKDAVLIGACYGDISSERARCRLESLSWRDKHGTQIEKRIEGWIVGEDGVAGIRGKVVDRSGDIAREAFGAGLLSAAASFLKYEATSSVYPVTPFGQTNALGKGDVLKGAVGTGASSALDKLAEFSIKRAEQMSPVIYVASGRVVDVLLKSGVDLTPDTQDDVVLVNAKSQQQTPDEQQEEN